MSWWTIWSALFAFYTYGNVLDGEWMSAVGSGIVSAFLLFVALAKARKMDESKKEEAERRSE